GISAKQTIATKAGSDRAAKGRSWFGGYNINQAAGFIIAVEQADGAFEHLYLLVIIQCENAEYILWAAGDAVVAGLLLTKTTGADPTVRELSYAAHESILFRYIHRTQIINHLPGEHLHILRGVAQWRISLGAGQSGRTLVSGVLAVSDHEIGQLDG